MITSRFSLVRPHSWVWTLGVLLPTTITFAPARAMAASRPVVVIAQADLLKLDTPLPQGAMPIAVPPAAPSVIPPVTPSDLPAAAVPPPVEPPTPTVSATIEPAIEETYTVGAGDKLQITLFGIPELSGEVRVGADGQMNLPWIGIQSVNRLTLAEVKQLLTQKYKPYLKRPPLVTLTLLETRPVRVVVAGEVNRPGTYEPAAQNVALPGTFTATAPVQGNQNLLQWPTLTQALQTAGGITPQANIRQVMVRRPLRDNRVRVTQVDLWSLIRAGNAAQDITLRDGDVIVVPQATALDPTMAARLGTASFSPRSVRVQVVGEVTRPGPVEIPTNSSLNQALLAAGGFDNDRARKSAVEFIRLNTDGTVDKRLIAVDLASPPNDETNPIVHDNDVVVVPRTNTTKVSDRAKGLGGFFSPVLSLLQLLFK
jgi:polysaccharide biosynthesis/export protein